MTARDLDPDCNLKHAPSCYAPDLRAVTGNRGDAMVRCATCGRWAPAKSLTAAARRADLEDSLDRPTFSPGTRELVIRAALKGVPVGVVDRDGDLRLVRHLGDLDRLHLDHIKRRDSAA